MTAQWNLTLIFGVLSVVFFVITIVVGFLWFRAGRRVKEPCWDIRSNNLIENTESMLEDLSVLFRGQRVSNLTVSKIMFWNQGRETIDGTDMVPADPLRIEAIGDIELLKTKVVSVNHRANQFNANLLDEQAVIHISFDYLDKTHGGVVQVVHTGTSSSNLVVEGSIKGVPRLTRRKAGDPDSTHQSFLIVLSLSGLAALWGLALMWTSGSTPKETGDWVIIGITLLASLVFITIVSKEIWTSLFRRTPRGLTFPDEGDRGG